MAIESSDDDSACWLTNEVEQENAWRHLKAKPFF